MDSLLSDLTCSLEICFFIMDLAANTSYRMLGLCSTHYEVIPDGGFELNKVSAAPPHVLLRTRKPSAISNALAAKSCGDPAASAPLRPFRFALRLSGA